MNEISRTISLLGQQMLDLDGLRTLVAETADWNGASEVVVREGYVTPDGEPPTIIVHQR